MQGEYIIEPMTLPVGSLVLANIARDGKNLILILDNITIYAYHP